MRRLIVFSLAFHAALCTTVGMKPVYKYRYETEDVMKTAESAVPIHGYHVIEGGYYPMEDVGYAAPVGYVGNGYVGGGGYGGGHFIPEPIHHHHPHAPIGYGPIGYGGELGYGGRGLVHGGGLGIGAPHGYGGEEVEKEVYSEGKKNIDDGRFEKAYGKKGEESNHEEQGYSKGQVAVKDAKGDSGYYSNHEGGKKVYEDGKEYHGGQHFDKEGKSEAEKRIKQGHKKGHKIKGFKSSHHKDESGHTEEYYDEDHDEGGNYNFQGHSGRFGEAGASSYKGGNQEGKFNAGEAKKQGFYDNHYLTDKANGNEGQYGQRKYAANNALYNAKNGADEQSLLGHQESSKFYKHHPFVAPFHHY